MTDADQPTATTFSDLAASTEHQAAFFTSLNSFLGQYGFDGVDIDWFVTERCTSTGVAANIRPFAGSTQLHQTAVEAPMTTRTFQSGWPIFVVS